jgi:uncharacterized membrane protein
MSETPNAPVPPNEPKPEDQGASGSTPPGAGGARMGEPGDVEKNKVMALLSYLGILVLVPILAAKDSPFAKYHANQGLILVIAEIGLFVIFGCFSFVIAWIPYIHCCAIVPIPLLGLACVAYAIMGILNAVNGKMKPLPGIPETLKIIK